MSNTQNTICAIASPAGSGAIAVIRLSGPNSFAIVQSIFKSKTQQIIQNQKSHSILFGEIVYNKSVIDEVLISIFKNPHSYTGEDAIEISCHGSIYVQQKILEILIKKGAQLAQAGEFTQRAFLNGKMDLAQAEGVADLIASESEAMHKISIQQLKGGFSSALNLLRKQMLDFSALIELELDFSEEDVEFANRTDLQKLINKLNSEIKKLINSFSYGNAIKNGIPIAIVGRPNAGKSTLLNTLLNEERAIVSEIAGTTRDTIEELLSINGFQFRFIDTAGLRTTTDQIEKIGVERTLEKINKSSIYLYLFDINQLSPFELLKDLKQLNQEIPRIIIANKTDLIGNDKILEFQKLDIDILFISAKNQDSLEELKTYLLNFVNSKTNNSDIIISNIRHFEALTKANEAIERVNNGIKNNLPTDLLAMDMRDAVHFIGEITGEISNNELLGHIFKNFCIGK
jgi:tRNA modification GTPase